MDILKLYRLIDWLPKIRAHLTVNTRFPFTELISINQNAKYLCECLRSCVWVSISEAHITTQFTMSSISVHRYFHHIMHTISSLDRFCFISSCCSRRHHHLTPSLSLCPILVMHFIILINSQKINIINDDGNVEDIT